MTARLVEALIHLGFRPNIDFVAQDDSDGRGPYLAAWLTDTPRPEQDAIDAAVAALEADPPAPKSVKDEIAALKAELAALTNATTSPRQ